MAGEPYAAGGIRTTVAATRAATDEQLTAHVARLVAGDAPAGHHDRRDQVRLRADRPRRGAQPGRGPAVHRRDDVPRRARRAGRVRRRPGRLRRPGHRPDARGRGAVRPLGRRVLRDGRLRRRPGPRGARRPARRTGLRGRLHASQLGPGPGVLLAAELGLAAVDHCTYLDRRRRRRAARLGHRRHAAARRRVLDPAALPRRPPAARRRRRGRAGQRLQPRAPATPARCRSASRSRSGRWG